MSERQLIRLSEVKDKPLNWLWKGYLATGTVNNLSGDPGQAKTRLTYNLAADITNGQPLPGCLEASAPAGVIILQGEDAVETMVKPALVAAGADLNRIFVYDPKKFGGQPLLLPKDIPLVEHAVADIEAKLLVIDPVSVFFEGLNSETSVRQALKPVADFADEAGIGVLIIRHLRKTSSGNPLYSGTGSIAWIAAARSELRCINDPTNSDPHRHLLVQVKTNLVSAPTLAYRTVMTGDQVTVEWLGTSGFSVKDLLGAQYENGTALWEAAEVLYLIVRHGPVPAEDVLRRARRDGVARRTLYRAKCFLRVKSERKSAHVGSYWCWRLPDEPNPAVTYLTEKYAALDAAESDSNGKTLAML